MSDLVTESSLSYLNYLGASMNDMRLRRKFIDTVLVCGERKFPAHRLVLCSRSPVFQKILLQDTDAQNCMSAIDLEDVEPKILDLLLEFMYLGRISNFTDLVGEDFNKLLTAAELLNINGAVLYMCHSLLERKQGEAVTILWDWASEFGKEEVVQDVIAFIADNLSRICTEKSFLLLSRTRLMAVLAHHKLTERYPQDDVMLAILKWIYEDLESREVYFGNFVSFVAIHKLSESYVNHLVREEPLIKQLPDFQCLLCGGAANQTELLTPGTGRVVKKLVYPDQERDVIRVKILNALHHQKPREALKKSLSRSLSQTGFHFYDLWAIAAPQGRNAALTTYTFPEAVSIVEEMTLMIIGRDDMNRYVVHLYMPDKQTWSLSYEIKVPDKEKMTFAMYKAKLFMIGGEDHFQRIQPDVFIFNIITQAVVEGPPMRVSRCKAGVAVDGGFAYIAGGLNRFGNFMTHVECLDMVEEVWKIVPSMREKRQNPGLAVVNNELFAIGGFTNRCESYDPRWENWQNVVPMPETFSQTAMVATEYNGMIYAFRYFKPDRVCCLNPTKNEWRVIRTSGTPPDRIVSIQNLEGELWTIDRSGRLFVFDVYSNTWAQTFCCPRSFVRPMSLFVLNMEEIKRFYEVSATPPESLR